MIEPFIDSFVEQAVCSYALCLIWEKIVSAFDFVCFFFLICALSFLLLSL